MDSDLRLPSKDVVKCCDYSLGTSSSDPWIRTVKRRYNEFKEGNMFLLGGSDTSSNAKVLVENECVALLEALSSQRKTVKDLHLELEEERNAAASAATETMSMILRLQREKAEIQLEARQFKTYAEEKMTHDQEKLFALEDLLYEKEQAIEVLTYEVEAYKHRLLSFGLTEAEMNDQILGFGLHSNTTGMDPQYDVYPYDYTSLNCSVEDNPTGPEGNVEVVEKVIVGQSPRWSDHCHKPPLDSYDLNSPLGTVNETKGTFFVDSPISSSSCKKIVHTDCESEVRDDMSDRVYTIDSVHVGISEVRIDEPKIIKTRLNGDHWNSPKYHEPFISPKGVNEPDIEKLCSRIQALEADRESMRQIIVSMQIEKAQFVLLKEIAQHLSKDKRNPARKTPSFKAFSVATVFKWIVSFVSWKRKARRNSYVYSLPTNNIGMLMFLDEGCGTRRWRCLTSAQI